MAVAKPIAILASVENEWVEHAPPVKQPKIRNDVAVTLSVSRRDGVRSEARAFVRFIGEAAEWVQSVGPKFRIQFSKGDPTTFRIIADSEGRFATYRTNGLLRLYLGHVKAWPNEPRDPVGGSVIDISATWLLVKMPASFIASSK